MTYLDYINLLWRTHEKNVLSPTEIAIYFWMLNRFNRNGWNDSCKVSNVMASACIGISENTLKKGRERLKNAGLLDFKTSKSRSDQTEYFLKNMVSDNDTKDENMVSASVSKNDTEKEMVSGSVSALVSGSVSALVSKIDSTNKTKTKTKIKEKEKEKESVCGDITHAHTRKNVLQFYGWIREYMPWCSTHLRLPNKEETDRLMETYNDEAIIRVMKNLENHKQAREKSVVLLTTLENWLEKDEKDGKLVRRVRPKEESGRPPEQPAPGITKLSEDEAKKNFQTMLIADAKKGSAKAKQQLRSMGIVI